MPFDFISNQETEIRDWQLTGLGVYWNTVK